MPEGEWQCFERWLAQGMHAGMDYMNRHEALRRDPRLLLDGTRSIVSVAFNYRQPNPYPQIAVYALGRDYHKVLRKILKRVVAPLREEYGGGWRICIDSAPILERYWAVRSGMAVRSPRSGNVVVPGVGSMVFLAEILTTAEIPESRYNFVTESAAPASFDFDGETAEKVCPTGALQPGGMVDSRRCINYLTIEHRGPWNEEQRQLMSLPGAKGHVFGCDICQNACPSNQGEPLPVIPEFQPLPILKSYIKAILSGDTTALSSLDLTGSPLSRKRL